MEFYVELVLLVCGSCYLMHLLYSGLYPKAITIICSLLFDAKVFVANAAYLITLFDLDDSLSFICTMLMMFLFEFCFKSSLGIKSDFVPSY